MTITVTKNTNDWSTSAATFTAKDGRGNHETSNTPESAIKNLREQAPDTQKWDIIYR